MTDYKTKANFSHTLYHYQRLHKTTYSRCLAAIFPNFNYFYTFYISCSDVSDASYICADKVNEENKPIQESRSLDPPMYKCGRNGVLIQGLCYYVVVTHSLALSTETVHQKCKLSSVCS